MRRAGGWLAANIIRVINGLTAVTPVGAAPAKHPQVLHVRTYVCMYACIIFIARSLPLERVHQIGFSGSILMLPVSKAKSVEGNYS